MKNRIILLTCLLLALVADTANAKLTINVFKCDPAQTPDGPRYENIFIKHDEDHHSLSCEDPGSKDCKWDVDPHPRAVPVSQQVEPAITSQIMNGIYSGQILAEGGTVIVDWSGTTPQCYSYSFEID